MGNKYTLKIGDKVIELPDSLTFTDETNKDVFFCSPLDLFVLVDRNKGESLTDNPNKIGLFTIRDIELPDDVLKKFGY